MDEKRYTPAEVARRLRLSEQTVRRWIRDGVIPAIDLSVGTRAGPYLITGEDLEEFERQRYGLVPQMKRRAV